MKKTLILSTVLAAIAVPAVASDYIGGGYYETTTTNCNKSAMYRELDNATYHGRAVTTVVKCQSAPARVAQPARVQTVRVNADCGCGGCAAPVERVVDRKYYVTETREVYKPVVKYVSAGTYTTTREVCGSSLCI